MFHARPAARAWPPPEELLERTGLQEERDWSPERLFRCFAALSDEDYNVLAEVVHRRLADRPEDGRWYSD